MSQHAHANRRRTTAHLALLAGWIALLGCLPFVGVREASWADLTHAAATTEHLDIHVTDAMGQGTTGYSTVSLHWRTSPIRHVTTARQTCPSPGTSTSTSSDDEHPLPCDVKAALQREFPTANITTTSEPDAAGSGHASIAGWEAPMPLVWVVLPLWFGSFLLFVADPVPPRWATWWAWAWWILSPASLAALVLWLLQAINDDDRRIAPRRGRRLTGGWSFLLSWMFAGAVASALHLG